MYVYSLSETIVEGGYVIYRPEGKSSSHCVFVGECRAD